MRRLKVHRLNDWRPLDSRTQGLPGETGTEVDGFHVFTLRIRVAFRDSLPSIDPHRSLRLDGAPPGPRSHTTFEPPGHDRHGTQASSHSRMVLPWQCWLRRAHSTGLLGREDSHNGGRIVFTIRRWYCRLIIDGIHVINLRRMCSRMRTFSL